MIVVGILEKQQKGNKIATGTSKLVIFDSLEAAVFTIAHAFILIAFFFFFFKENDQIVLMPCY